MSESQGLPLRMSVYLLIAVCVPLKVRMSSANFQ